MRCAIYVYIRMFVSRIQRVHIVLALHSGELTAIFDHSQRSSITQFPRLCTVRYIRPALLLTLCFGEVRVPMSDILLRYLRKCLGGRTVGVVLTHLYQFYRFRSTIKTQMMLFFLCENGRLLIMS